VGRVDRGFVERKAERERHADGNRDIHVDVMRAQRPEGALEEGLSRIGRRRQRDQSRQPVKQVAGLLRHVGDVAGPHRHRQQHHVHRGEAGDREAFHEPSGLRALIGVGAFRRERMRLITDRLDRRDDLRRVDLVVAPIDGEPALGEIDPRLDDAGQCVQAVLDFSDAARARNAFDRERHMRCAGVARLDEQR
jgi:hypothetical protein